VSSALVCRWRAKFGGIDMSMMTREKEHEDENRRLYKIVVNERLKSEVGQEAPAKSVEAISLV
jgi:putative transposase